ncbi:hypothetical protein C8R43DRAFT_505994 [Mycena crocata]|nr:hypothetical protein C8R43DRAFT_505994 [Mycena crocata]
MRAILHRDYMRLRYDVWLKQVNFMRLNPSEQYFVGFDYTKASGVVIHVGAKHQIYANELEAELPNQWWRLLRAEGRMEMHLMLTTDPTTLQLKPRVFPLRSKTSDIHDGLRLIARGLPERLSIAQCAHQTAEELRMLCPQEEEVWGMSEIH